MISGKASYIAFYFMHTSDNYKKIIIQNLNTLRKGIFKMLLQISARNNYLKAKK